MENKKIKLSKKRLLTGALAGTMVLSSFAISAFSNEAEAADSKVKSNNVVLYEKDTELSDIAAKAISTKTYKREIIKKLL